MCVRSSGVSAQTAEICKPLLLFLHKQSLHIQLCEQRKEELQEPYCIFIVLRTHVSVYIVLARDGVCRGERLGTVGLTLSAPVVYADEGHSSHFSITQNPANGCLLAAKMASGCFQVIVCCKHGSKL